MRLKKYFFSLSFFLYILTLIACEVKTEITETENDIFISSHFNFQYPSKWGAIGTGPINKRVIHLLTGESGPEIRVCHNSTLTIPSPTDISKEDYEDTFSYHHPNYEKITLNELTTINVDGLICRKCVFYYSYKGKDQQEISYYFPEADIYIKMLGKRDIYYELLFQDIINSFTFTLEQQPGIIPIESISENLLIEYPLENVDETLIQPWTEGCKLVACKSFETGVPSDGVSLYIINSGNVLYRFPDINALAISKKEYLQEVINLYVDDLDDNYQPEVYISCIYKKSDISSSFTKTYCFKRSGDGFLYHSETDS